MVIKHLPWTEENSLLNLRLFKLMAHRAMLYQLGCWPLKA